MFMRRVLITGPIISVPVAMAAVAKVHAAQADDKPFSPDGAVVESPPSPDVTAVEKPKDVIQQQLEELKASKKDRTLYITQLPLYGEPVGPDLVYIAEKEDPLRQHVSVARQAVWKQLDNFEGAWNVVKDNYRTSKKYTQDLARYLREDAGALPRATFIAVSGLGGVVAGYKGGFFRKSVFAGAGMVGAASVCYPHQAVDISKRGWILTREQAKELWQQATSGEQKGTTKSAGDTVTDKPDSAVTAPPVGTAEKQAEAKDKVLLASKDEQDPKIEAKKDFGMSKEEDKDMYSTRKS